MSEINSEKCVVVQLSRLPENVGRMLNMYLSGNVTSLHLIGVTKDGEVINTSTSGIPGFIKKHDSLI